MLCAGDKFAMFYPVTRNVRVDPVEMVPSGFGQAVGHAEGLSFGVAPGHHHLAADAILELPLMLDDENLRALFRHVFSQGCAAQAAAGDGHIVRCRHAQPSGGISRIYVALSNASKRKTPGETAGSKRWIGSGACSAPRERARLQSCHMRRKKPGALAPEA